MKVTLRIALLLSATAALAWPAHAGRPLQTEDAGILEPTSCEIEGVAARERGGGLTAREASLRFGCGVGLATQLALAGGRASVDGSHTNLFELAGKSRLWTGAAPKGVEPPGLTLAYVLAATKTRPEGWKHGSTELSLVYTRELGGDVTLHSNLGHARDERAKQRSTTWAFALEHASIGGLAPMAEVYGDDRDAAWWNLGLRWTVVPEKVFVDGSWGRQMTGDHPSRVTLGFKLAF